MAGDNGLNDGSKEMSESSTSRVHVLEKDRESSSGTNGNQKNSDKAKEKESTNLVPFHNLFSFADSTDAFLMIIGTIGAVGNGLSLPLMTVLFGQLSDAFGQNQNSKEVVHVVSEVSLIFVYRALGAGATSLLEVTCWMVTGERHAARYHSLFRCQRLEKLC